MKKIKLYEIKEEYIAFLKEIDLRVLSDHELKKHRKYADLGLCFGDMRYLVPLSSPDAADFDRSGKLRKTVLTIFRLRHNGNFLGKLLLNNMIPVPDQALIVFDINRAPDLLGGYMADPGSKDKER